MDMWGGKVWGGYPDVSEYIIKLENRVAELEAKVMIQQMQLDKLWEAVEDEGLWVEEVLNERMLSSLIHIEKIAIEYYSGKP